MMNIESSPAILQQEISAHLSRAWGHETRILEYTKISERVSVVARIWLAGDVSRAHPVIVKHIPESQYPAESRSNLRQEFLEEMVSYRFLESLRPAFPLFPQEYSYHEKGFILLEDLASDEQYDSDTMATLSSKIAQTLASLHIATRGKGKVYQALRKDAGLPKVNKDGRAYGFNAHRRRYRLAAVMIKDYCAILAMASGSWGAARSKSPGGRTMSHMANC